MAAVMKQPRQLSVLSKRILMIVKQPGKHSSTSRLFHTNYDDGDITFFLGSLLFCGGTIFTSNINNKTLSSPSRDIQYQNNRRPLGPVVINNNHNYYSYPNPQQPRPWSPSPVQFNPRPFVPTPQLPTGLGCLNSPVPYSRYHPHHYQSCSGQSIPLWHQQCTDNQLYNPNVPPPPPPPPPGPPPRRPLQPPTKEHILLRDFNDSFVRSCRWDSSQAASVSPYYSFLTEQNKVQQQGWLRRILNLSSIKKHTPLEYLDVLSTSAPVGQLYSDTQELFYHAFGMKDKDVYNARKRKRELEGASARNEASPNNQIRTPQPKTTNDDTITFSGMKDCKTPTVGISKMVQKFNQTLEDDHNTTNSNRKKSTTALKSVMKYAYYTTNENRFDVHRFVDLLLPDTYSIQPRSYIDKLREKGEIYRVVQSSLQENLGKAQYKGSEECSNIIAGGLAMVPSVSLVSAQYLIAAVRYATITQLGYKVSAEDIAKTSPSAGCLSKSLIRLSASCLGPNIKVMNEADYLSLSFDKGHKDGTDHMVKIAATYSDEKNQVCTCLIDMDSAGGSDEDAALAIQHSLSSKEIETKISSIGTDSGGGGTTDSVMEVLKQKGLVNDSVSFVSPCSLHILQLVFAVAIEKVFGLGSVEKSNALQCLHSTYDLEKCFGRDVFRRMMREEIESHGDGDLMNEPTQAMPKPVTTRWWWLSISCDLQLKYWKYYNSVAKGCINTYGTTAYANIVASNLHRMMREELFYVQILFISCFSKTVINPHFQFLQKAGDQSKKDGFNTEAMAVRTFLIDQDLASLQDGGWKDNPGFRPVLDHFDKERWPTKLEDEEREKKEKKQQNASPSIYAKQNKTSGAHKRRLMKDIKTRQGIDNDLRSLIDLRPENYWNDLHLARGNSYVRSIYSMLGLPNQIEDPSTKKKRAPKLTEKTISIEAFGQISREQFDLEYNKNKNQIRTLEENLAGENLGQQERLLHTFENNETGDYCNKEIFELPLRDLFHCDNQQLLDNIDVTEETVQQALQELREAIRNTEQEIRERQNAQQDIVDEDDDAVMEDRERDEIQNELEEIVDESVIGQQQQEKNKAFIDFVERQINIVLKIAKHQNDKHFRRWTQQLIFCGIASEKETAKVVVDALLGKSLDWTQGTTFNSRVHDRKIDLHDFARKIHDECHEDEYISPVRSTQYFIEHQQALQKLSDGHDLWHSTDNQVSALRSFVRHAVLIVPSNTQFVELAVKEGSHIGATNRSEAQRSVLGIIRTLLVKTTNNRCVENANNRELRANQHTQKGMIGERKMVKKTTEKDNETRPDIRGSPKATVLIELLEEINKNIDVRDDEKHNKLVDALSKKSLSFQERRKTQSLQRYRNKRLNKKRANKLQERQAIIHTDVSLGRIAYSSLRTEFIDEVKLELDEFEQDYPPDAGVMELRNLLKQAVISKYGKKYDKSFHPETEQLQTRFPFSLSFEKADTVTYLH